tara:strand:+ start:189 stop:368 length:180 start_codon:yes stop_codon:yes gene_type:complete
MKNYLIGLVILSLSSFSSPKTIIAEIAAYLEHWRSFIGKEAVSGWREIKHHKGTANFYE